jgi:hypothetical protein
VALEARPANVEGKGEVTVRDLVRNALRMRPDRIIVGEVRGGEALDMLQAMNTGHEGSLSTAHAESSPVHTSRPPASVRIGSMRDGNVSASTAAVDLYWIPLGAGAHVVRISGKTYEAVTAFIGHRPRFALYHSALEVRAAGSRFVIESAPVVNLQGDKRGVVAEGPVGIRWAGRFRLFRYEIRRWRDGSIPDASEAVASPVRVATDDARAQRILDLVPLVPTPVWGRDELQTGDMWNSNSLTSWVLGRSGVEVDGIHPPSRGRAPGWHAGIVVARRGPLEGR